jgi:hypothetical protein
MPNLPTGRILWRDGKGCQGLLGGKLVKTGACATGEAYEDTWASSLIFSTTPCRRRARMCGSSRTPKSRSPGCNWVLNRFGEAEVEQFHDSFGRDLDVGRFQIAVNDAAFVRILQCFGDLAKVTQSQAN